MTRKFLMLVLAVLIVAAVAAPALAAKVSGAQRGGLPLEATLTGEAERPGPGDPDGTGTALITLNFGHREVCWELTYEDISAPTAAHIHEAPPTEAGPVVVPLDADEPGCATVDGDLMRDLRRNPSAYYVNIHNAEFPAGAIRGQLERR